MASITAKELEERSKKIFSALGLKDLDIKISRNDNGKKTTEHVHVDKDGAKVETNESPNYSESTKKVIEEEEKYIDRYSKSIKNLSDWLLGKKTYDQMFSSIREQFEERCKEKFGNLDAENLIKEIDHHASTFFDDPVFGTIAKSLNDVGLGLTQEDINQAAETLKKMWIPSKTKSDSTSAKSSEESLDKKKLDDESKKETKPVSKAAQLRDLIRKEEDAKAANEKLKAEIIEKIQKAINGKAFETFDEDGVKSAGIEVPVIQNHAGSPVQIKDIYISAGNFIREDYGFSSWRLLLPEITNITQWRFKFWF